MRDWVIGLGLGRRKERCRWKVGFNFELRFGNEEKDRGRGYKREIWWRVKREDGELVLILG